MEIRFKKREVLSRFRITEYALAQWIEQGILDNPVRLTETSHPFWTTCQIEKAEQRLLEKANGANVLPESKPRPRMKAFSDKLSRLIKSGSARVRL